MKDGWEGEDGLGTSAKAMNGLLVQLPEEGAVYFRGATVGHKHASTRTDAH